MTTFGKSGKQKETCFSLCTRKSYLRSPTPGTWEVATVLGVALRVWDGPSSSLLNHCYMPPVVATDQAARFVVY